MIRGPVKEVKETAGTTLYADEGAFVKDGNGRVLKTCRKGEKMEAAGEPIEKDGLFRVPVQPRSDFPNGGFVAIPAVNGFSTSDRDLTRPSPGMWPNRTWPPKIGQPPKWRAIESLFMAFAAFFAGSNWLLTDEGDEPTAVQQARALQADMNTRILATVQTGGWVTGWVCSIIQLVAMSIQDCQGLFLIAVKGGPACDEELVLIDYVLERFGFIHTRTNEVPWMYEDTWARARSGAAPITVFKQVFRCPEHVFVDQAAVPLDGHGTAPNLVRLALVSAPVWAVSGINQALKMQLDSVIDRARRNGFAPYAPWDSSQEAHDAFAAYMEASYASLANQGIVPTGHTSRFATNDSLGLTCSDGRTQKEMQCGSCICS